jgi:hypothetical protein
LEVDDWSRVRAAGLRVVSEPDVIELNETEDVADVVQKLVNAGARIRRRRAAEADARIALSSTLSMRTTDRKPTPQAMMQFIIQLRGELRKLFGRKRTYIGFGAFIALEIVVLLIFQIPRVQRRGGSCWSARALVLRIISPVPPSRFRW